jgi:drug/metabolite transporter (DMT)-like permease
MLALGAIGFGFSFSCYAGAITLIGVSLATLLTCTHPIWTTLLAWRFLGEPIRRRRVVAIVLALIGCALVVQVFDPDAFHATLLGSALGLAAGVTYAVYSTLGKHLLQANRPIQVTLYTLAGGTLFLLPIQSAPLPTALPTGAWTPLVVFVLGQVLLAPLAFNLGLQRLEAGTASILSTWEVVVAVLIGVLVLHETMEPLQALGAALVGASIVLVQLPSWRGPARWYAARLGQTTEREAIDPW